MVRSFMLCNRIDYDWRSNPYSVTNNFIFNRYPAESKLDNKVCIDVPKDRTQTKPIVPHGHTLKYSYKFIVRT